MWKKNNVKKKCEILFCIPIKLSPNDVKHNMQFFEEILSFLQIKQIYCLNGSEKSAAD